MTSGVSWRARCEDEGARPDERVRGLGAGDPAAREGGRLMAADDDVQAIFREGYFP